MNMIQQFFSRIVKGLNNHCLLAWMTDESNIKLMYWANLGKQVDLVHPSRFNEKLQWLKLHDRNPLYCQLVDKYEVRDYISKTIGEEYLIPLYGIWDRFRDIHFESLPQNFVLKCTHDSGSVCVCRNKQEYNISSARKRINTHLRKGGFIYGREWPYKDLKPRIIAEKYLVDSITQDLRDYKIHCFNGVPKLILVCSERMNGGLKEDWFTTEWEHLPIHRPTHMNNSSIIERPKELEELLELSKTLSADYRFVRTDFYIVDGKVYFSEITFFPTSGYTAFIPEEYDSILGNLITL